mgnify:CR=1 FL=1
MESRGPWIVLGHDVRIAGLFLAPLEFSIGRSCYERAVRIEVGAGEVIQRLPPLRYCPSFLFRPGGKPAIVAFLSAGGRASRAWMTFSRET